MRGISFSLALLLVAGPAHAQRGGKAEKAPAKTQQSKTKDATPGTANDQPGSSTRATTEASADASGKPSKAKVYTFSGLDLEGKLKTPQLLYFLNRVRVELDSSSPGKRSFMKELERSADDPGL